MPTLSEKMLEQFALRTHQGTNVATGHPVLGTHVLALGELLKVLRALRLARATNALERV